MVRVRFHDVTLPGGVTVANPQLSLLPVPQMSRRLVDKVLADLGDEHDLRARTLESEEVRMTHVMTEDLM